MTRYGHDGWAYWHKAGVAVLAGNHDVRMRVPKAWRDRVAMAWSGFVGGFYLRDRSACVPIVVSVGIHSRTVRFGIGRRCP